jgi:hypothetical protein
VATAAIGFLGVVVGALLAGVLTDVIERRNQRRASQAAATALIRELGVASAKLESATKAVATPGWWVGTPVTSVWRTQAAALASTASEKVFNDVAHAYAEIETWAGEREKAGDRGTPPSHEQISEIKASLEQIATAKASVEGFIDSPPGYERRKRAQLGTVVVVLAATAAFVVMLLLPRTNVNAATVASAVESVEGRMTLAECDRASDHWVCTVDPLAQPLNECASGAVRQGAVAALGSFVPTGCDTRGPPAQDTVDVVGNSLLIYTTPGAAERGALGSAVKRMSKPTNSWLDRVLNALFGE